MTSTEVSLDRRHRRLSLLERTRGGWYPREHSKGAPIGGVIDHGLTIEYSTIFTDIC